MTTLYCTKKSVFGFFFNVKSQCTLHRLINLYVAKLACARSKSRILRRKGKGYFVVESVSFALLRAGASLLDMTEGSKRDFGDFRDPIEIGSLHWVIVFPIKR